MLQALGNVFCSLFLSLLYLQQSFANDFSFQLEDLHLSSEKTEKIQRFLEETSEKIPSHLKSELGHSIPIHFMKFPHDGHEFPMPQCPEFPRPHDNSKIQNGHIFLNSLFISEILKGESASPSFHCGHKNFYRLAMATILHQVAHLYDLSYSQNPGQFSSNSIYYRVAGWKNTRESLQYSGSPDSKENNNLSEHFAVNLEYFLLDPEYKCHRPALSNYYKQVFQYEPPFACEINTKILIFTSNDLVNYASFTQPISDTQLLENIDPKEIYQVHYLIADKDPSEWSSRFGHAMFRLIRCRPGSIPGPDCLHHREQHITVSYMASPDSPQFNLSTALLGKYRMISQFENFESTLNRYNNEEYRDLKSFPILFTEEEKAYFIYKVLEEYWTYQTHYNVFKRNCASEVRRLLNSIFLPLRGVRIPKLSYDSLDQVSTTHVATYTPIQLLSALSSRGLIKMNITENEQEPQHIYYFPSSKHKLQRMFNTLKTTGVIPPELRKIPLKSYLNNTSSTWRRKIFEKAYSTSNNNVIASFTRLELEILKTKRRQLFNEAIRQNQKDAHIQELSQSLTALTQRRNFLTGNNTYGIPLAQETSFSSTFTPAPAIWSNYYLSIKSWLNTHSIKEQKELDEIQNNIQFYSKHLKH